MRTSPPNSLRRIRVCARYGHLARGLRLLVMRRIEAGKRRRTLNKLGLAAGFRDAGGPVNRDAGEYLPDMMRRLGVNPSAAMLMLPRRVAELRTVCSRCRDAGRCRRWLGGAGRGDDPAYRDFCPNAGRLETLRDLL